MRFVGHQSALKWNRQRERLVTGPVAVIRPLAARRQSTRDPPRPGRLPSEGFTMELTEGKPGAGERGQSSPASGEPPAMAPTRGRRPRRRRWLIVAFVLVLVVGSMVSWWNWPRGDTRFVGTWSFYNRRTQAAVSTIHFGSNGIGWIAHPMASGMSRFRWQVQGDRLILGETSPSHLTGWIPKLALYYRKATGVSWMIQPMVLEPTTISHDEVILRIQRDGRKPPTDCLRRIPE